MTKQKKGFWLFICSLIPGAGELYMGFRKMGLSIMILFWGCIACASLLGFNALIFLLPIIWFYSFFNAHNLKSLTEEEFLTIEDHAVLSMDAVIRNKDTFTKQYRTITAVVLIVLGISGIWNSLIVWLYDYIPDTLYDIVDPLGEWIPTIAVSIILIIVGVKLISGKRTELERLDYKENAEKTEPAKVILEEKESTPDNSKEKGDEKDENA